MTATGPPGQMRLFSPPVSTQVSEAVETMAGAGILYGLPRAERAAAKAPVQGLCSK